MAEKLYWNTPRIQVVNKNNIYKLYNEFSRNVIGEEESQLSDLCIEIFNKNNNPKYYGHIITLINLLGLIQYKTTDNKLIVEKNTFLYENMDNMNFIEKYLDYSLTYFQYPRHNVKDSSVTIRKPYIIILLLLKKLFDKDPKEAYLTKNEFYYLFYNNKPYKSYDDINDTLVSLILDNERAFGKQYDEINMQSISYDLALFKNSSVLTFDNIDYQDNVDFAFGLSKEYNVMAKLEWLLSEDIRNDISSVDSSLSTKKADTKWANFLNNKDRFKQWEEGMFFSNSKLEIGETGEDSGIEEDGDGHDEFMSPFNPEDISIDSKTVSLDTVLRRLKNETIRLSPDFQRNSVWDISKKSRLIESMMLKIPLPMFYIARDQENNWDVVDGLQRLTTIQEFILGTKINNKYSNKGFKLKDLEFWNSLNGETYETIPDKLYNNIAETELSFTIINPDTPEEVKRNIFKRINTGGMPLSAQEIRHALYQGDSTRILEELVNDDFTEEDEKRFFMNAVNKIDDTRMGGRELILRFLSFYVRDYTNYIKDSSMDKHLSDTMRIINVLDNLTIDSLSKEFKYEKKIDIEQLHSSIKKVNLQDLKKDFKVAMKRSLLIFDEYTFRKSFPGKRKTPINKTLFEVFGNLLLQLNDIEFDNLLKNKIVFLKEYKENYLLKTEFAHMIGRDSHRVSSVKKRYNDLYTLLKKYT